MIIHYREVVLLLPSIFVKISRSGNNKASISVVKIIYIESTKKPIVK
jgi:hypothetical protein